MGIDLILDQITSPEDSIRLKSLEIVTDNDIVLDSGGDESAMVRLIDSFDGLEELFMSTFMSWNHMFYVWLALRRHEATLKRLVTHQRAVDNDIESSNHGFNMDCTNIAFDFEDDDEGLEGVNFSKLFMTHSVLSAWTVLAQNASLNIW